MKTLLLFDELNHNIVKIYFSIVQSILNKADLELIIYDSDPSRFLDILISKSKDYDYYLVIPPFNYVFSKEDFENIPFKRMIIINQSVKQIDRFLGAVIQDFKEDFISGLNKTHHILSDFKSAIFLKDNPFFIEDSVIFEIQQYASTIGVNLFFQDNFKEINLENQTFYILSSDRMMSDFFIKMSRTKYILNKEVGVMKYDDTAFSTVLGIPVLSTNYLEMGRRVADMVLNQNFKIIKNSSSVYYNKPKVLTLLRNNVYSTYQKNVQTIGGVAPVTQ